MKKLVILLLALVCFKSFAQNNSIKEDTDLSPLSAYSPEWNKPVYSKCNTSAKAVYMTEKEIRVIYILNLARTYPKLFVKTVLAKYPAESGNDDLVNDQYYYQSLINTMLTMNEAPLLNADEKCFTSAACHAKSAGKKGYTGHNRIDADCEAKKYYSAECCDYGNDTPLEIVLSLLIDKDVPSLGHRRALLGTYSKVGVSIQPHKTYRNNAVIDFEY
jgi:uncharacterized protein YkwD